ncbi:hypothetical protein I3F58_14385 [Streptomyces sp. MUM 203J]|uniref:hypothetical protein n=1 Tax=Streptomyces sp. MUM 203J TaxID=2791990 RepID=UPI001F03C8F8|nr:hypothetical protein [Streptomyces sp. MUM 203J]MCH0540735.1 hypothetical protein [Streptomyces sp. MUM 203J]
MAFSADEVRVLRCALGHALHPTPLDDQDVRDCLRLADAVDDAAREGRRLRAFVLADLARYRASLPGAATGYLELLQDALAAGYDPLPDDLAALRTLRGTPVGAALLARCQMLAERSVRARLAGRPAGARTAAIPAPASPRTRLYVLQGGRGSGGEEPKRPPRPQPPKPSAPAPAQRPVPKPSEVFPPRRRPAPGPPPPEKRAAG